MLLTKLPCYGLIGLASLAIAQAATVMEHARSTDDRDDPTANARTACHALAREFPTKLYMPNTPGFLEESSAIWSQTCLITPSCVFEPKSAQDIGNALKIIDRAKSHFAVRAGGHMPIRGAQSVRPGVMIALSSLNQRRLSRNKDIASIGPGQTWGEIYKWLEPHGLAVNGGRYSSVGVGGLLLSGGIGFFSSRTGWGVDSIVAMEVVKPDGCVVTVTANNARDRDLFWALRGGHNYFGIVTRFDMKTIEAGPAFVRTVVWNVTAAPDTASDFFDALGAYMAPGGGVDDPNVAILPTVAVQPSLNLYQVVSGQIAFGRDPNPQAFRGFNAIEGPTILDNEGGKVYDSWTFLPEEVGKGTSSRDLRQYFYTTSFKPDPRAISIANKTVIDLAQQRGLPEGAAAAFTFQPISKAWLEASEAAGGNPLDIDSQGGTLIAGILASHWHEPADDAFMVDYANDVIAAIERETKALGLYLPFKYLGDAGEGQNPLATYGNGRSVHRLRRIQRRYDPRGFFKNYLAHAVPL